MSVLTSTENVIDGYIFCPDGRCPGNAQVKIKVICTEVFHPYEGSTPGYERSMEYFRSETEPLACPHCGIDRLVSDQERPNYLNISGHDPLGLLDLQNKTGSELAAMRQDAANTNTEIEDLKSSVAELTELLLEQAKLLEKKE